MVGGIALLGVVTASIASWFVETVRATGREVERDAERLVARSEAQLDAVLAELRAAGRAGGRRNCRCAAARCPPTRGRPRRIMIMPVW
jgi:hypothetical protein